MGFSEGASGVVPCMPLWARAAHIVQLGPVRIEQDLERSDRLGEAAEEPWRPATTRQHRDHFAQPGHDGSPIDASTSRFGLRYGTYAASSSTLSTEKKAAGTVARKPASVSMPTTTTRTIWNVASWVLAVAISGPRTYAMVPTKQAF